VNDLGSLSQCMLENDAESSGRARISRRKAFVASVLFEALLLAALLIWPLLAPGVLSGEFNVTPAPPYHGGGGSAEKPAPSRPHPAENNAHTPAVCIFCAQAAVPTPSHSSGGGGNSLGNSFPGIGEGDGPPGIGPAIPGADGSGKFFVEISKPDPPKPKTPAHISEGVMAAALIYKVQPIYPPIAIAAHMEGTVRLRAIIGTDGRVRELVVLSGNPILANPAMQAVRLWRYQPTRLNGEAEEVETLVTVNFVLN
jgi:periplasmic protein TonB